MPLEAIMFEHCDNGRESWCRVWTCRAGEWHISELACELARRVVPVLLQRYGMELVPGIFAGRVVLVKA